MHQMSVFKSSSKSHLTPPLDLSEGRRHVESPLDLSVKTRKRCADTTEYGEISRHNILSEATMAKRLFVTRDYDYPQGHPNFNKETYPEKTFQGDSVSRSKMIQQKQLAMNKYPNAVHKASSQVSPSTLAQQQYVDIQRQHINQQTKQLHLAQSQKLRPAQYGMGNIASSPQVHSGMQQKSQVPYETAASTVKRSQQSMTESVALKGFFEPTHKVTVNAGSSQQSSHLPQQSVYQRPPAEQRFVGPTNRLLSGKSNEHGEYEERTRQMSFPNTSLYQRQGPEINRSFSGQSSTASERELMQQKSIQYQRQLQVQKSREQISMLSQKMMLTPQGHQKMAYLMDIQKQNESRVSQSQSAAQAMYGSRGQHSPYTQSRQPASATASYQDSLRKERSEFSSSARCIRVGQPVPLSDIHQEHSHALEQVHAVQNRPEIIAQQQLVADSKLRRSSAEIPYTSQQAMLNAARMQHTIRYEPSMRYGISKESNESSANYIVRADQNKAAMTLHHPSVIQRPQGYIPPRIVRGGGRAQESVTQRLSSESQPQIPRYEYNSDQISRNRQEVTGNRERSYTQKHDMLSGKEVMKIQQRVAEQRGDVSMNALSGHNKIFTKTVQHRDANEHAQSASTGSSNKGSIRRRSLQDQQIRENIPSDISRSVSNDGRERKHSISRNTGSYSPSLGGKTPKQEVGVNERQMISMKTYPSERSITKGTSGLAKGPSDMDPFSQFLMRELKKTDDDRSVNPFANRSLLEEFDRSANSSPVHKTNSAQIDQFEKTGLEESSKSTNVKEISTQDTNITEKDDPSYTLPLQIAIPGHKVGPSTTTVSSLCSNSTSLPSSSVSSARSSVIASSKSDTNASKNPKLMSRKHMILSAFRQEEEDLKNTNNTVNIDQNEKVPMESAKFAARKSDKESNQHGNPSSPKMPILSPQERNRTTPLVSPAVGEPPNLEDSSKTNQGNDSSKKEINSLEEHLHRLISDAVKGSVNKDKESVYESVRRELSSQPQSKVFLSRQLSQTKNIPVANVAPIVHGKAISDALEGRDKSLAGKLEDDFDEEDDKMADIVTRSLFGDQGIFSKELKSNETVNDDSVADKQENEAERSDSNISLSSFNTDTLYDENSNSKRMSPGLKKLMLYRHRDTTSDSSEKSSEKGSKINKKSKSWPAIMKNESSSPSDKQVNYPKGKGRNVFGAFSEIVAQQSNSEPKTNESGNGTAKGVHCGTERAMQWTKFHQDESERRDITMVRWSYLIKSGV